MQLIAASFLLFFSSLAWAEELPVSVTPAFPNLRFERPLDIQSPKDGTNRLFIVEQGGVIKVIPNDPKVSQAKTFLDIRGRVAYDENEQGLLGLGFHPDYSSNRYFYVNYNAANPLRTVISRFQKSPDDPDRALPDSEEILLEVNQPYSNHNGGQVSFGPDGYLYIGLGDGGSSGDPKKHAQNLRSLLGKILRIDVNTPSGDKKYSIPPDNPWAKNRKWIAEEIYAYGLRNPWRFSWGPDNKLWVADVGQWKYEEIHWVEKGKNYGWNIMEGSHCFKPETGCTTTGLEKPVIEYEHAEGRCVIGGFVYRGSIEALKNKYIYSDFTSGAIWAADSKKPSHQTALKLLTFPVPISSYGEDQTGELLFTGFDGLIYRFSAKI